MISKDTNHTTKPLVDFHHHMVPPDFLTALEKAGLAADRLPSWSPEDSLRMMDGLGIEKAILSLTPPGVWLGDRIEARRLSRACNRYGASLTRESSGRFGALAALPFPDVVAATEELVYALDGLHLDGVMLLSNVVGKYVGDPEYDSLMKELDDRGALVLLHPNVVPQADENAPLYGWTEYPIDVARAYARLVHNDTLVRFPQIRWVLAHAGGVVPFLADRIGRAHYANGHKLRWGRIIKDMTAKRNGGLELAKGLSYDTVGAANSAALAALRRLIEPQQLCFGSNFPWDSEEVIEESLGFMKRSFPYRAELHEERNKR